MIFRRALSLTGVEVGGTQTREGRPFTTHEKITKLLEHLRKHEQMPAPFMLETFYARKVFIPPAIEGTKQPNELQKGLGFWISTRVTEGDLNSELSPNKDIHPDQCDGKIYLLEEMRSCDDQHERWMSSYSALTMLRDEFLDSSEFKDTAKLLPYAERRTPERDQIDHGFFSNPFGFLDKLGAKILPEERHITSLFRIRMMFSDSDPDGKWRRNLVGYPVFIASA